MLFVRDLVFNMGMSRKKFLGKFWQRTKMGWKLGKSRRLSASRSTGDLLKTVRINREKLQHKSRIGLDVGPENSPRTEGYLYVLADGGFWFRMWVKLGSNQLETYYERADKLPLEVVGLSEALLVIPPTIEAQCPEDRLYPLRVVKKEQPVACLAAESSQERTRWAEAIQNCLETRSLDIEGLNLEYSLGCSKVTDGSPVDRGVLLNKLDLVEELLAQRDKCGELPKDKKTLDLCQKMVDADNWYDRILISEQQEALRRATYLKQRKISTQLKADTIKKQLSKSSKNKRRPKSLCAPTVAEEVEFYEEQLEELNNALRNIHTSLGQTEMRAEVAYRKLGRKRESEMKRLHSDADLHTNNLSAAMPNNSASKRASDPHLPTIWISRSQEDCRLERKQSKGSFVRRNSPKSVKKYFSESLKLSSSTTSIWEQSRKKPIEKTQSAPPTKNRISPLRLLGNFVDSQLFRSRNKVKKMEVTSAVNRKSESDSAEEAENCPRRSRSPVNGHHRYKGLTPLALDDQTDYGVVVPSAAGYGNQSALAKRSSSTSSEKVRTEIDPDALAEIEAFESLTEQFLQDFHHVK